jgi:hypothetical protein
MPRRYYRVVEDDEGEEEEVECASLWRMIGRSGGIGREHQGSSTCIGQGKTRKGSKKR